MNVEPPMNTEPRAGRGRGRPRGRGRRRGRGHGQGQNVNIYRRSERIANNPVANEMYDASDEDQEIEHRVPRLAEVGHQITLNQLDNIEHFLNGIGLNVTMLRWRNSLLILKDL